MADEGPGAAAANRGGTGAGSRPQGRMRPVALSAIVVFPLAIALAIAIAAVVFQDPAAVALFALVLALQSALFGALALVGIRLRRAILGLERGTAQVAPQAGRIIQKMAEQHSELHMSLLNDIQALEQLMARYAPSAPLPPMAGWALSPTALQWLTDRIERDRPSLVVECGSGTSTLWMSLALRRVGSGRLLALEHSEEYTQKTRLLLERHGLSDWAEVRHAPLVPTDTPRGTFSWYSLEPSTLSGIGLLLVDGPPGATGPHARYPALPVLAGSLAADATIVLDDADRSDEREIITYWCSEDNRLRHAGRVATRVDVLHRP